MPLSERPVFWPSVPILWGDNEHDDSFALRHLFHGGAAYDMRTQEMITAHSLRDLPEGVYRTSTVGAI